MALEGTRERSPAEYGTEQFREDLRKKLEEELRDWELDLQTRDEADANILETGPQRVRFEKDKKGEVGADAEISDSAQGFVERELERDDILKKMEATRRVLARLSPKQ